VQRLVQETYGCCLFMCVLGCGGTTEQPQPYQAKTLSALISDLSDYKSGTPSSRMDAVDELKKRGQAAREPLLRALLLEPDQGTGERIGDALSWIHCNEELRKILMTRNPSAAIRRRIVNAVSLKSRPDSIWLVKRLVNDPDRWVRLDVCEEFEGSRSDEVRSIFGGRLKVETDLEIKRALARAIVVRPRRHAPQSP